MHVRLRLLGKPEAIIVVESKLSKIDQFRSLVKEKLNIEPKFQRLIYCGKELENGYTFHDYSIKVNDVIQLIIKAESTEDIKKDEDNETEKKQNESKVVYKDVKSKTYEIGDLVDARDVETGAWFEGKIIRTVLDPNAKETELNNPQTSINYENVSPNIQNGSVEDKQNGIKSFFSKASNSKGNNSKKDKSKEQETEVGLLYQVEIDGDEESKSYYKLKDLRPRARHIIDIHDLKIGQCVMINHNTEDVTEKGYWYDFKVSEIKRLQKSHELIGTLYLADAVPQHDTKVRVLDKIYAIEAVVPVAERNKKYYEMIKTEPEKRSQPLNCLTCRDNENAPCKDCGCFKCLGKEDPDKIILCDECNNGYHMTCLPTPLTTLPSDDWYCPSCKREDHVTKQAKKVKNSTRDWGRGMACVGKTKTCSMPPNHFGPIPGIEVGMKWRFRIQLSESGVHRPPVSGIHGRDVEGAYSIVLSGGYEDDYDNGREFTYTGSGGRDLSGNKRTADQSCDQTLTRENKALARNCAVKLNESGADAEDNWKEGKPVRVVRSYKMIKHFPQYAPKEGIRYDGIYKVVKYYPEKGKSGFQVWKYLLRRDDPVPAPWEKGAKQYDIVYPDGYLEAEAEKRAQKEKNKKTKRKSKIDESSNDEEEKKPPRTKRNKQKSVIENDSEDEKVKTTSAKSKKSKRKVINDSSDENEVTNDESPVKKKRKVGASISPANGKSKNSSLTKSPNKKIPDMFTPKKTKKEEPLSKEEIDAIKADQLNSKLWEECLEKCNAMGKKHFIDQVTEVFLCIICQDVVANPVTTPCLHNFCMACLKLAYKSTTKQCPCCRGSLANFDLEYNEQLKVALRTVMPGYDAGKK